MAETLISPGVFLSENDLSQITQGPIVAGAAILGPTVLGPVNIPTLVTSYSDFQIKFGDSFVSGGVDYSYLTSIAAYNYFNYGGKLLTVARVASGSFTSAYTSGSTSNGSAILNVSGTLALQFSTLSQGTIMNSSSSLDSSGSLISGSADNIRWQIANSDTSSGTFFQCLCHTDKKFSTCGTVIASL